MPHKSKTKGNSYERDLAKFLSQTFEASFVRNPGSGAFLGRSNVFRKATLSANQIVARKGDVTPPDHMPKLIIEAKAYASFPWHQLLRSGPCPQLDSWIEQARETMDEGDVLCVVFKINRLGEFVAIPAEYEEALNLDNHARYSGPQGCFIVTEAKSFFTANRYQLEALSA